MEYLRAVDFAALVGTDPNERRQQWLLDEESGSQHCSISCIRTPAGSGSPAGLHVHAVDQVFYILEGIMSIEIDGQTFEAKPGSLVYFPAGIPHRNWNAGEEATVHLAVNTPVPDPNLPFASPPPAAR